MPEDTIEALKLEINRLREELSIKEQQLGALQKNELSKLTFMEAFTADEITRYSRQMLVPSINANGQYALKNSKVLIVGAGGLGCPAALYLASAGVGEITLVDYDEVELSNLHRQILHGESSLDRAKVDSACDSIQKINKNVKVIPLKLQINSQNIEKIIKETHFNLIIDCSDNVPTRYLLNDACVLNNIPLISGSALQMDGQLTVYNYKNGPCYRCLFPKPPPTQTVMSCGDAGVLGAIPGVIGVLQALEAIKIITDGAGEVLSGRFLIFDGLKTSFREVKLRHKNQQCNICGIEPTIHSLIDYEQFCGSKADDKVHDIDVLTNTHQIDVCDLPNVPSKDVILDVRPEIEYQMCHLPFTTNFSFLKIEKDKEINELKIFLETKLVDGAENVYVMCRRGNDSQKALLILKEKFKDLNLNYYNVKGGLRMYSKHIDSAFPIY